MAYLLGPVGGVGPSLPPWTAGPGTATSSPGAATSETKAGWGHRATNRPDLSRGGSFRRIASAEALVLLPCSISYSVGLFAGGGFLPGASLIGRGLVEPVLAEEGERASGGGQRGKKEKRDEKLCRAVVGSAVSCYL